MADGSRVRTKRQSIGGAFRDTDPRFSFSGDGDGRKERALGANSTKTSEGKKRPRVAFTGEEFGFGYLATGTFLREAARECTVPDAGLGASKASDRQAIAEATRNTSYDYNESVPQPLRTKEQALLAVQQKTADFAVVPFYHPYAGYDFESLRALASLYSLRGVQQIAETDKLCLAVHESQLYDIVQSSHPGTGFSSLQRRFRKSWGPVDNGSDNRPSARYEAERFPAGLPIDAADQKLIRDRIDVVFAGPEAARRCKSRLDGLRSIGVKVEELSQMVEPHRELARRARATVNTSRQTNTFYDPVSGETRFFSTLGAEAQAGSLFGMVLPYEVAMRSSDYVIIDHDFDDAPAEKTRFMVVEVNPDHTLFEDAYRTTYAKTRYWMRRLREATRLPEAAEESRFKQLAGSLVSLIGLVIAIVGAAGILGWPGISPFIKASPELVLAADQFALAFGIVVAIFGLVLNYFETMPQQGIRLMLRFRRDGTAASIADVENFLRNYGVRHAIARLDEDSEHDKPASILLDIEFSPEDFRYDLSSMFTRRLRGSVANGALKKAFQIWKNREVLVLAAMPIERVGTDAYGEDQYAFQLPKQKQRRWWSEAFAAWAADAVETWFIRLSRLLIYILPVALAAYAVWTMLGGGKE